ncbi:hypothetical protein HYU13_05615 [Candidatus Woesearchaeota archaeon]|nr:hypothetical protein [Candidatus Woesearchaeota archaeon]
MAPITISEEQFGKVLKDVELLITDVANLVDQDTLARKRIADIEANPSIGKTEEELDAYLKKRGVKVDAVGD